MCIISPLSDRYEERRADELGPGGVQVERGGGDDPGAVERPRDRARPQHPRTVLRARRARHQHLHGLRQQSHGRHGRAEGADGGLPVR